MRYFFNKNNRINTYSFWVVPRLPCAAKLMQLCKKQNGCMTVETLTRNWNDYDRQKTAQQKDAARFDISAEWELAYLTKKIKSTYPFIPETLIREAIQQCARRLTGAVSRASFTEDVLRRLSIPL
jgi:hypothetical protein